MQWGGCQAIRGTAQLMTCLLKSPLMTWKIVVGICQEALKLRLRDALWFEFACRRAREPPGTGKGVRTW
ncbi:hypothetical protein EB233_20160 [Mesorhizobium erdmanii]|uniref:Uncharacterized protein n=1 Tax=Mesorhizobium erdmanii TaxID=1777866 RepID=A0A6M7UNF4_9HYPH|nr:hypothetical protein A8146_16485 [Mesorhizobium loti]QKC77530.1 hypothetical protein EB233_20160 [Mesorhizobium erdmanii]